MPNQTGVLSTPLAAARHLTNFCTIHFIDMLMREMRRQLPRNQPHHCWNWNASHIARMSIYRSFFFLFKDLYCFSNLFFSPETESSSWYTQKKFKRHLAPSQMKTCSTILSRACKSWKQAYGIMPRSIFKRNGTQLSNVSLTFSIQFALRCSLVTTSNQQ